MTHNSFLPVIDMPAELRAKLPPHKFNPQFKVQQETRLLKVQSKDVPVLDSIFLDESIKKKARNKDVVRVHKTYAPARD